MRVEPGTLIGPYKLLEQIGEGSVAVVFAADQLEPVRRKVAVKILKPQIDDREVVARFEAERQCLAIMDHPNIVRIHDGGSTDFGRPYFVMELVNGLPITEYCDRGNLALGQRLELMVQLCRAMQHAHCKGIIYRDLKPSDVLVTAAAAGPVVKLIDFGRAMAMGQKLTVKALFTGFFRMIGEPAYMSPEQAGCGGEVETRSDIYCLGSLLYELVTGTTPFDPLRFHGADDDTIRSILCNEQPPSPSTRLAADQALDELAAIRGTTPHRLIAQARDGLDAIVMKCLEKNRDERYETAGALAEDLEGWLGQWTGLWPRLRSWFGERFTPRTGSGGPPRAFRRS